MDAMTIVLCGLFCCSPFLTHTAYRLVNPVTKYLTQRCTIAGAGTSLPAKPVHFDAFCSLYRSSGDGGLPLSKPA